MVTSFRRLHFERTHTGRRQANAWRTYMEEGVSEFDTERAEHRRDQRERLHLQALQPAFAFHLELLAPVLNDIALLRSCTNASGAFLYASRSRSQGPGSGDALRVRIPVA